MLSGILESLQRISFNGIVKIFQNSLPVDFSVIGYWILLLAILLIFGIWFLSTKRSSRLLEALFNNLLIVSFVIWVLGVIVYIIGFYREGLYWLSVVPRAIIASFKMFVTTNELARVGDALCKNALYMSLFSLVHFAAAFITFMFIFKMVGYKIKFSLKMILEKWSYAEDRTIHLFWGVNEASCLLAEDINRNHATDLIVLVDIDEEFEDDTKKKMTMSHITNTITIKNSEISRLDGINALLDHCYNGPVALKSDGETDVFGSLHLKSIGAIVRKSSRLNFYFLSNDESQNIVGALNLQKDKTLCSIGENRSIIYVHARRDANNEIFDYYSQYDGDSKRVRIKIIDSAYLSIARLKQDDAALPVNCVTIDKSTGLVDSSFTALIVGFGGTGQEAFKFLYEFSAFVAPGLEKSPFKCYAVDENMDVIAGVVREKMPDIGENELSLIKAAVDSKEFWDGVRNIINGLNYVVIALNNDTMGLSLAVNLLKFALKNRQGVFPMLKIMLRCYDDANERRMTEVVHILNKSIGDNRVEIRIFGRERELYCCNTILSDSILTEAKEFNRVYENSELSAEEQWEKNFGEKEIVRLMTKKKMSRYHAIYDIKRRIAQNISNSLHAQTKLILMGFDKSEISKRLKLYYDYVNTRENGKTSYSCGEEEAFLLRHIAMVEHERWVASHKLMGYTYNRENDCVQKHHRCICPWNDLDEMTQSYDCSVVDTTIRLAYEKLKN